MQNTATSLGSLAQENVDELKHAQKTTQTVTYWSTCPVMRGQGSTVCSAWRREDFGVPLLSLIILLLTVGLAKTWSQVNLHSGANWENTQQAYMYIGTSDVLMIPSEARTFFTIRRVYQWDRLPRKAVQPPIFGDFQDFTEHNPEQPSLSISEMIQLWIRDLRRILPAWIILWSCGEYSFLLLLLFLNK